MPVFGHQLTSSDAVTNELVTSRSLRNVDCDEEIMEGRMCASLLARTLEMIFWIPLIRLIGQKSLALREPFLLGIRQTKE